ncbi:MAG: energy-coupling factor transporter transmembrane protein EcfT [Planctomycetaceae bacterium]|nr:energy-coupling factor transporter transmembrane protein EcfT [Planctomycetaceae bacterium]
MENAHATSAVHHLDPRVKIAWSVVVSLLAVILRHPGWLAALLAVAVAPWCLVRFRNFRWRWLIVMVATTVVGSMLSQGFFYAAGVRTEWLTLLPGLSLCKEGLAYGCVVSLRLLAVVAAGAIVVFTTQPPDLIAAMHKLRVPKPLALTLTSALRLLPEIAAHGKRIFARQSSRRPSERGLISAFQRFCRLLVPLLAASFRTANQAALEADPPGAAPSRNLRFGRADWTTLAFLALLTAGGLAVVLLGYDAPSGSDPASTAWPYLSAAVALVAICGVILMLATRTGRFRPFTPQELATAAVLICLLRISVLPWQIGLAKLPGLNALIFAIPYTAIFLTGLRLAPRPGFATLLIVGQGALGQLLGSGINPAWWPYYLFCAAGVEALLFLARYRVERFSVLLAAALLRGFLATSYSFLIAAPLLWHKFYAPWYVVTILAMDLIGCAVGGAIAWRLAPTIEKAAGRRNATVE